MYTVNKTRSRKKLFLQFVIVLILVIIAIALAVWFFVIKNNDSSTAQFKNAGGSTVAIVKPATIDFKTNEFSITLPEGWESLGKLNPNQDSVYYEYQSKVKDYDSRWLRVYIDTYPEDYAISRLLPITVVGNKIDPGILSGDCKSFKGAPNPGLNNSNKSWTATWDDIEFACLMGTSLNHVGTSDKTEGYGVKIQGEKSGAHKYFFVYIDHSVRPDYNIMIDAVESFEAL